MSIKVIGSRSNKKNLTYIYITVTSVCLHVTKTYLKGQGHLKVKVKVTEYNEERGVKLKEINFLSFCKCFCDLCVTRMVCLGLKGILVLIILEQQPFKMEICSLTIDQDM